MKTSVIPERNDLAVKIVKFSSSVFLSLFFKIMIRGADNIPQRGSFVLLPKHQRWEDIPLIATSIDRSLYYVAKQELFNNFLSKNLIAMLGGLPINRIRPSRSRNTLSSVLTKLEEGKGVVIFPEGTYFKNRVGPGQIGLVRYIFSNVNTRFIPAGIEYNPESKRINVKLVIGNPVKSQHFEDAGELLSYIMEEIALLSRL